MKCFEIFLICCQQSFHFAALRHSADGALPGGDNIGCRIGKAEHSLPIFGSQTGNTVFQHKIQYAGAEGVAGAGGLNGAAQLKGGHEHRLLLAIEGVASVGAGGDVENLDVGVLLL